MNCDHCGERPGEIRYTEMTDGEVRRSLLCRECARELGVESDEEPAAPELGFVAGPIPVAAVVTGKVDPPETAEDPRRCPACGAAAADLETHALFGCATCYDTFASSLEPLLRRLHHRVRHRGRIPGGVVTPPTGQALEEMRRQLDVAISEERFDDAAELRDQIQEREREEEDDA
ncbi:MAG: UvrB/UvrC motif-containing protein [Gemmatimonadetes bacterium]|nr:UvrB/UvrC motif-containing protein [Gemmatimonadota bacterium]